MWPSAAGAATLEPLAAPSDWGSTPIHAASPPGDARLFVVERGGAVRIVKDGTLLPDPFLTVPNVDTGGERGLLSIAFPPDYAGSGLFYVFTVAKAADSFGGAPGDLRILEYERSAGNPDLADPGSARLVFSHSHSAGNHNGGQLAFGPDDLLYVTIGDNASSANAQDLSNDLGKVLRIDPDPPGGVGFGVPPTNPFVATPGAKGEIYAWGLRNPFRASFAPDGSLVLPDVGQGTWEEVNAGNLAGANLGWPTCEGVCTSPQPTLTNPVFQYAHGSSPETTTGCAIIGGYVVRDATVSSLLGRYLYGDLCRSDLRTLDLAVPGADPKPAGLSLPDPGESLLSFGEDSAGRVYVLTSENAYRVLAGKSEEEGPGEPGPGEPKDPGGTPGKQEPSQPGSTPSQPSLANSLAVSGDRQRLRGHVEVAATCSAACTLRATGTISFRTPSSRLVSVGLRAGSGAAGAGESVAVRPRLRQRLRARARQALEAGRAVLARIEVRATDGSGNATRKTVQLELDPLRAPHDLELLIGA